MKTVSFIFSREDCQDFKNYPACNKTGDALFRKPASRVVCVENQILFVDVRPVSMRHNADAICYLPVPFHGELHYPNDSRDIPNVATDIQGCQRVRPSESRVRPSMSVGQASLSSD